MLTAVQTNSTNDDLAAQASAGVDLGVSMTESRNTKSISIGSMNTFINDFNPEQAQNSSESASILSAFSAVISGVIQGLFALVGQLITAIINQKNQTSTSPATTPASTATTTPAKSPATTTSTSTPEKAATTETETKPEDKTTDSTENAPTEKTPPPSRQLKKSGEFLWKPTSEKDGNLVILCRSAHTGKIASVKVLDPKTKKVLAKGKQSGVGNGNREHYRFDKPGSSFPDGAIVEITLKNGEKRTQVIKETSQRFVR